MFWSWKCQTCTLSLLKTLINVMEWCVLVWCFDQLFGLSFWRHPFTAEDQLVSKWCKATFLQICSEEETILFLVLGRDVCYDIVCILFIHLYVLAALQLSSCSIQCPLVTIRTLRSHSEGHECCLSLSIALSPGGSRRETPYAFMRKVEDK